MSADRRRLMTWAAVLTAAIALLVVAVVDGGGAESDAERIQRLSESYACPQCQGESVAESNAAVAATIRRFIADEVAADATDLEIRDALIRAYGAQVLLNPPAEGLASLLWILPVGLVVGGAVGVAAMVRRDPPADGEGETSSPVQNARRLVLIGAGVVFVIGAGFALGQATGERGVGDQLTGGIDESARNRVATCQELGAGGQDLLGALQCFDEVLVDDPDNAEALAYRGWYLVLAAGSLQRSVDDGASEEPDPSEAGAEESETIDDLTMAGLAYLDRAIEADPRYPDPLAFRATINDRLGHPDEVCADVATLLALDPPAFFIDQTAGLAARNDC